MSPRESMVRRSVWYSGADPARLAEHVPTGAVTYMIPSERRCELPGPDSRPAEEKAKAIFELMAKLGIRYPRIASLVLSSFAPWRRCSAPRGKAPASTCAWPSAAPPWMPGCIP